MVTLHVTKNLILKKGGGSVKRYLIIALLLVVALAFNKTVCAGSISWVSSPDANTMAFGNTVVVGLGQAGAAEGDSQPIGIFGAGFTMNGTSGGVRFDSDLYTWDSYAAGDGYFDAFVVTVSTVDYYWNLGLTDPIASSASTFVWGGADEGGLESYVTSPGSLIDMVLLTNPVPTTFYVSLVLDTSTLPDSDDALPSYGSFHVEPIPEPGTIALLGIGLAGLVVTGVGRKMKKKAEVKS